MKPYYYYVLRVGHKHPTVRHATAALAVAEAERLAAQHPGDTFEVLQCLAVTRTTTPVTEWLDGCGPSQVAAPPPPPEPGYIEITDPEEIIREGDEIRFAGHTQWMKCIDSVGIRGGKNPAFQFRRPDPTRQVVPIPEEYLPLPPLPEGKTQWVGRGRFNSTCYDPCDRKVWFLHKEDGWIQTSLLYGDLFHIEAV